MAAIRDTLVITRRILLMIGWVLVIVEFALGSAENADTGSDWARAHQQVRTRVLEARRAQSIHTATDPASKTANQPEDRGEPTAKHPENNTP